MNTMMWRIISTRILILWTRYHRKGFQLGADDDRWTQGQAHRRSQEVYYPWREGRKVGLMQWEENRMKKKMCPSSTISFQLEAFLWYLVNSIETLSSNILFRL